MGMRARVAETLGASFGLDQTLDEIAASVLVAMREPTDVMLQAGAEALCGGFTPDPAADRAEARLVWQAMLDAAKDGG